MGHRSQGLFLALLLALWFFFLVLPVCPTHLVKPFVVVKEPEGILLYSVTPLWSHLAFSGNWLPMHLLRKALTLAWLGS